MVLIGRACCLSRAARATAVWRLPLPRRRRDDIARRRESAMTETNPITIYVDADACPVKDEIYRVAARFDLPVVVVANGFVQVPRDPRIERVAAGPAPDAADNWIAERAGPGPIVITADIP